MFELLDELENLEAQLSNTELSEDERKTIESRIIEIKDSCDIMKKTYHDELNKLKETYKSQVYIAVQEFKGKADKKKKDNASKLEKHLQEFNKDKEKIKDKIKDWRDDLQG